MVEWLLLLRQLTSCSCGGGGGGESAARTELWPAAGAPMALGRQVRQALLLACAFGVGYEFFGASGPDSKANGDAWPTPLPPQPLPPPPPAVPPPVQAAAPPLPPPLPVSPSPSPPTPAAVPVPQSSPAATQAPPLPTAGPTTIAQLAADAPAQRRSGVQTSAAEIDMWSVAPTLSMENRYNPPRQSRGVGSWTQGWDINLDKGEFERGEKLEIYVVPHSHNDPGWKETFEEWYSQKTGKVLDTMVRTLSARVPFAAPRKWPALPAVDNGLRWRR